MSQKIFTSPNFESSISNYTTCGPPRVNERSRVRINSESETTNSPLSRYKPHRQTVGYKNTNKKPSYNYTPDKFNRSRSYSEKLNFKSNLKYKAISNESVIEEDETITQTKDGTNVVSKIESTRKNEIDIIKKLSSKLADLVEYEQDTQDLHNDSIRLVSESEKWAKVQRHSWHGSRNGSPTCSPGRESPNEIRQNYTNQIHKPELQNQNPITPPALTLSQKITDMKLMTGKQKLFEINLSKTNKKDENRDENLQADNLTIDHLQVHIILQGSSITISIKNLKTDEIIGKVENDDFVWDFVGFNNRMKRGLISYNLDGEKLVLWW